MPNILSIVKVQKVTNNSERNNIGTFLCVFQAHSNKFIVKRSKRQVFKGPPEVDENIVSAFLNSPEAVQMVLSYFNKQKNLTPIPVTTTTTTTPRPKPPPPPPKRRRPRPPPPPLSFFFGGNKPLGKSRNELRIIGTFFSIFFYIKNFVHYQLFICCMNSTLISFITIIIFIQDNCFKNIDKLYKKSKFKIKRSPPQPQDLGVLRLIRW